MTVKTKTQSILPWYGTDSGPAEQNASRIRAAAEDLDAWANEFHRCDLNEKSL